MKHPQFRLAERTGNLIILSDKSYFVPGEELRNFLDNKELYAVNPDLLEPLIGEDADGRPIYANDVIAVDEDYFLLQANPLVAVFGIPTPCTIDSLRDTLNNPEKIALAHPEMLSSARLVGNIHTPEIAYRISNNPNTLN